MGDIGRPIDGGRQHVEGDVRRLHVKIQDYEKGVGFDAVDPFEFTENPEVPAHKPSAGTLADD